MLKENLLYNLKKAANFITTKEYEKAIAIYMQLLAEIPSFPDAYYGLYKVAYLTGDKQNAKIYLSNALKQLIISSKENKQHKDIFKKWELEYKNIFNESFLTPLVDVIEVSKKYNILKNYKKKKYLLVINELKKIDKYDIELLKIAFYCYVELHIINEALKIAYELLYYLEVDESLFYSIAKLFEMNNLVYPSVRVYLYLSNIFKKSEYFLALGRLSLKLDNHGQAKVFLNKAIEIDSSNIKNYSLLGQVYSIDGEYTKLEELLKYAYKHTDKPYERLITLLFDIGNIDGYEFDKKLIYDDPTNSLNFLRHQLMYAGLEEANEVLSNINKRYTYGTTKSKTRNKVLKQKIKDFDNVVAFHTSGRGGSFFFHALIDGHSEVATIPGVYLKGYFGANVFNNIESANKKDMIEKFMQLYEAIFDASSFKTVPGSPMGGKIKVGEVSGLTTLGENRDISLSVDKVKFAKKLYEYLDTFSIISEKDFFSLIHIVWEEVVRGANLKQKKCLFYHIHNPDFMEYYRYLNYYKKSKDLVIIRNWLQGLESWMDSDIPTILNENWLDNVAYEQKLSMFQKRHAGMYRKICNKLFIERYKILLSHDMYYVKLEDVKNTPESTMKEIAKMMKISYEDVLVKASFMGLKFHSNKSKLNANISEFDKTSIKRKVGVLFSDRDAVLLNTVLRPWNETFEYDEGDFKYVSVEEALKMNENIMDWEYKVAKIYGIKEEDIVKTVKYRKQKLALALNTQEQVYEELKKERVWMSSLICGDGNIFFDVTDEDSTSKCLEIMNLNLIEPKSASVLHDISTMKVYRFDSNQFVKAIFAKMGDATVEQRLDRLEHLYLKYIYPKVSFNGYDFVEFCLPWEFLTNKRIDYHCCNCKELKDYKYEKSVVLYIKIKGDLK